MHCVFGLTGVTLGEKWTTDNVLTTQITVEDQVFKFLSIPFQKNETRLHFEKLLKIVIIIDEHLEAKPSALVTSQSNEIMNLSYLIVITREEQTK